MQIIENSKIKEKIYTEKLDNGLRVIFIPKNTRKKYIVWATGFGSIDNKFKIDDEEIILPDGIAHYLEHKMFEQESGRNALDTLSSLGVEANAYTTNNHTAYLFECTDNFYEALDEFMDYVQNPYFTDENVEKERGIIEQEIMMYDDYPEWALYMNAMKCMYKNNEINIDVAGTKETISKIDKDKLYTIYNSFYTPENMVIVVAGDFKTEEIFAEIKKRIKNREKPQNIQRIYNVEPKEIVSKRIEKKMDVSMPCFIIGFKDNNLEGNKVKKDIAVNILGNILFGKSTEFFRKLYENGKIISDPSVNFEFAKTYSHVLIQCQTNFVDEVITEIENRIDEIKQNGISDEDFNNTKKRIYGEFVKEYNDVSEIANNVVLNYFRDINIFDYFEEFESVNKEYTEKILNQIFNKDVEVISIININ